MVRTPFFRKGVYVALWLYACILLRLSASVFRSCHNYFDSSVLHLAQDLCLHREASDGACLTHFKLVPTSVTRRLERHEWSRGNLHNAFP